MKHKLPLRYIKPFCMVAVLAGIFLLCLGNWVAGLCMLVGANFFERNLYCCPCCGRRLDMKAPLFKDSRCPFCLGSLRKQSNSGGVCNGD